jgi:hypothetical protein
MTKKLSFERKQLILLGLMVLGALFIIAAIFSPWWSLRTSTEAETITNSAMTVDFNLFQSLTATCNSNMTDANSTTTITSPIANITAGQTQGDQITSVYSVTLSLTAVGLTLSIVTLLLTIIPRKTTQKYTYIVGVVAAIVLLIAPLYLATTLDMSKASTISPIPVLPEWISLTPSEITTFWGSKQIPTSAAYPTWAQGQRYWIWGPSTGWYLTYAASFLIGACSLIMRTMYLHGKRLETQSLI